MTEKGNKEESTYVNYVKSESRKGVREKCEWDRSGKGRVWERIDNKMVTDRNE